MPATDTDYVLVRMPARLKKKVRNDAFKTSSNMTQVINEILGNHYGITVPVASKRGTPFGGGANSKT